MKVLSDTQIREHLHETINSDSLRNDYIPMIKQALADYGADPSIVPERTIVTSSHPECDTTHLFMPCAAPNCVGTKVISGGSYNSKAGLGFQGFTSVLDWQSGQLIGVVNGKTLTAFRTALTSFTVVDQEFGDRTEPVKVVVFGTGPQAYWHVFLVSRAYNVSEITVISRSRESAETFAEKMASKTPASLRSMTLDEGSLEEAVKEADIVFGCIPSTVPSIKKKYLDEKPTRRQLIILIGSYKPHMVELDPEFVKANYKSKFKVLVDSKAHALAEAGELVQSGLTRDDLISLNDYYRNKGEGKHISDNQITVAKIVGLSIMDMYSAKYMLEHVDAPSIAFD